MLETLEKPALLEPLALNKLNVSEIQKFIPHRYPFLLIDRVTEHEPGKYIEGYKNISINEQLFQGHFPGNPLYPGVLQLESIAQLGAVLVGAMPEGQGKIGVFLGIDNARFRKMVVPGDRMDIKVELLKLKRSIGKFTGEITVNEELVCEAEMMFAITERGAREK